MSGRPTMAGHAAMMLFSVLVAGSFALGGLIARDIAPLALNAVRFGLAALLLAAAALATGGFRAASLRAPWRYGLIAASVAIYFVLMFEALRVSEPVPVSAVFTLTPVMSAGFGWLLLRQRPGWRVAGALALGAAGALWVIFRADWAAVLAFQVGRGEAIFFWGCLAYAMFPPLVQRLSRGERPLEFMCLVNVGVALILLVVGAPDLAATEWRGLTATVWVTIGYMAVFATAGTFVLVQFAAARLPAAKVMAYTYLTPAWVLLWQLALGGAAPSGPVLLGVAITGLALLILLPDAAPGGQPPDPRDISRQK